MFSVVWPRPVPAGQPESATVAESPWPESDTVLDLLRADARAALAGKRLERAQDWLATMPGAAMPAPPMPSGAHAGQTGNARDQLEVLAIYGVGRSLHADIMINGELWRYRQGRHWPQGVADATGEPRYSLVSIEQPCVRLRMQESTRTACLHGNGGSHE
jgi:hypothetical protein